MKSRAMSLVLATVAAIVAVVRADDLPIVQTGFEFDSRLCTSKLDKNRPIVEERLSKLVMGEFEDPFEFIDWRLAPTVPVARLVVKLHEDRQSRGVAFFLQYWRIVPSASDQMERFGDPAPLYSADDFDRPWNDPDLDKRISKRVRDDIRVFGAELNASFLSKVPLSHSAPDGNKDERKIVLPLSWKRLHASSLSMIQVNVDGQMRAQLTPILGHKAATGDLFVSGVVWFFNAPPLVVHEWNDRIPLALVQDRGRRIDILMLKYELDRDTDKGTAVLERVSSQPE